MPTLPLPWQLLPHRAPFLFLDRMLTLDESGASGLKIISTGEPRLAPAALLAEAGAELAGTVLARRGASCKLGMLAELREGELRGELSPGDVIHLEARLERSFGKLHRFAMKACRGGEAVFSGVLTLHQAE